MNNETNEYDIIIEAINHYTDELDRITKEMENISLNEKDQKEFQSIVDNYDEKELMTEYLDKIIKTKNKKTKLYKYLQLYREGISTNEELSVLVQTVANTDLNG